MAKQRTILTTLVLFFVATLSAQQKNSIQKEILIINDKATIASDGFNFYNNQSHSTEVTAREVEEWISVGTNSSPYGSYNYPIDTYFQTSLTQCIYTADQINHSSCLIEQLEYTYRTVSTEYPDQISLPIKVWLCNTDIGSLDADSGYWIPYNNFTKVFEGNVQMSSGVNKKLLINLSTPFVYGGRNLCVMVERVFEDQVYQNHFNFNGSVFTDKVTARLYVSFDTPYDFTLPTTAPSQNGMSLGHMADIRIGVSSAGGSTLKGTISNQAGNPVEGVLVTLDGTDLKVHSNAQGYYEFPFLSVGNYSATYTAYGYNNQTVTINVSGETVQNVTMEYRPKAHIQGTVIDKDNNPVEGVTVSISGYYTNTSTITVSDGFFDIPEIYHFDSYSVTFTIDEYLPKTEEINVNSSIVSMGNIVLSDRLEEPSKVVAVKNGADSDITWLSPADRIKYRRDGDGILTSIGHSPATDLAVMGQVFTGPAKLYQMSWYLESSSTTHETVNIFVFDLDSSGVPTKTILYKQYDVPSVDDAWSTFTFPDTLNAPNGFMIGVSHAVYANLGVDAGTNPDYPFVPGANYVTSNYLSLPFVTLEEAMGVTPPGNLMVRAEGYKVSSGKQVSSPNRKLNAFNVYRLPQGQENNMNQWTRLAQNLTDKSFTDSTISEAQAGWYRYAITGVYSSNIESPAGFSNVIQKGLTTVVTLKVTTNTPTNESLGAEITLASTDGLHRYTSTVESEDGVVNLGEIFKARYHIAISHEGFDNFVLANVDLSTNESYTVECEIIETLAKPSNLEIVQNPTAVTFKWNHTMTIFDDFESSANFEITPSGPIKWRYIDADQQPVIGISGIEYPNEHVPQAFMIFNPSETSPGIDVEANPSLMPFSGNRYLVGFGIDGGTNDDYLISPKLNFDSDFILSFKAKSFDQNPNLNKVMVGYSTTGYLPSNFTWITQQPVELPHQQWNSYQYNIPANAKYVTIRNVSTDAFILMIDNVEIKKAASKHIVNYKVYLNGVQKGETSNYTFDFPINDLQAGDNIAGVKAVYSSGESELATITFTMSNIGQDVQTNNLSVYPNPSTGEFTISFDEQYNIDVINMQGSKVYSRTLKGTESVDLSVLGQGVYIITAKSASRTGREVVVIK